MRIPILITITNPEIRKVKKWRLLRTEHWYYQHRIVRRYTKGSFLMFELVKEKLWIMKNCFALGEKPVLPVNPL
jgi:Leu/Phe-tRNA-protein transferase